LDNIDNDFLEKYWDYNKNIINPWKIDHSSRNIIYIYCQEKEYHGSYKILCNSFINGERCGYCYGRKVHPLDSLGKLLEEKDLLNLWSNKNNISSYEYSPMSNQNAYWKCSEGIHEDYPRKISVSNICDFRCPECQYSKGEEIISNYFISKGFIKIDQYDFMRLTDEN